MNRIDSKFQELKRNNEKALVGFVTAGDPDVDRTHQRAPAARTRRAAPSISQVRRWAPPRSK